MDFISLSLRRAICVALLAVSLIALSACDSENDEDTLEPSPPSAREVALAKAFETSSCFWVGPYVRENPETNVAYPDTGAFYWTAEYTQPEGAQLKLKGEFPFARYISFNSYLPTIADPDSPLYPGAVPTFAIADYQITPDDGATNPFINGNSREEAERSYTLDVISGAVPDASSQLPNSLYEDSQYGLDSVIIYRLYVPDEGFEATGGVALPEIELTLASGEVLTGDAACESLNASEEYVRIPYVPAAQYTQLKAASYAVSPVSGPSKNPPQWNAAWGFAYSLACDYLVDFNAAVRSIPAETTCPTSGVTRAVGYFANIDNQYLYTHIDRAIDAVVVTRGKMPAVPTTVSGDTVFNTDDAQMRYWSLCSTEFLSQQAVDCLYDEQVSVDADGYYTIVTSLAEDRPANATQDCGVGFLPLSPAGDGVDKVFEGETNITTHGYLILRNMLPTNDFTQTAQAVPNRGAEAETMGDYMPESTYYTKAEFEALGCSFN